MPPAFLTLKSEKLQQFGGEWFLEMLLLESRFDEAFHLVYVLFRKRDNDERHEHMFRLNDEERVNSALGIDAVGFKRTVRVESVVHTYSACGDSKRNDGGLAAGEHGHHSTTDNDEDTEEWVSEKDRCKGCGHGKDTERPIPVSFFFGMVVLRCLPRYALQLRLHKKSIARCI